MTSRTRWRNSRWRLFRIWGSFFHVKTRSERKIITDLDYLMNVLNSYMTRKNIIFGFTCPLKKTTTEQHILFAVISCLSRKRKKELSDLVPLKVINESVREWLYIRLLICCIFFIMKCMLLGASNSQDPYISGKGIRYQFHQSG